MPTNNGSDNRIRNGSENDSENLSAKSSHSSQEKVPSALDARILGQQGRFLEQYARTRTKTTAARYAGIHRTTVRLWEVNDTLGFRAKLAAASEVFTDSLEQFAVETAFQMKPNGSPILLLSLLNANLPEKYRSGMAERDDTVKNVLAELKQISMRQQKTRKLDAETKHVEEAERIINTSA